MYVNMSLSRWLLGLLYAAKRVCWTAERMVGGTSVLADAGVASKVRRRTPTSLLSTGCWGNSRKKYPVMVFSLIKRLSTVEGARVVLTLMNRSW